MRKSYFRGPHLRVQAKSRGGGSTAFGRSLQRNRMAVTMLRTATSTVTILYRTYRFRPARALLIIVTILLLARAQELL